MVDLSTVTFCAKNIFLLDLKDEIKIVNFIHYQDEKNFVNLCTTTYSGTKVGNVI